MNLEKEQIILLIERISDPLRAQLERVKKINACQLDYPLKVEMNTLHEKLFGYKVNTGCSTCVLDAINRINDFIYRFVKEQEELESKSLEAKTIKLLISRSAELEAIGFTESEGKHVRQGKNFLIEVQHDFMVEQSESDWNQFLVEAQSEEGSGNEDKKDSAGGIVTMTSQPDPTEETKEITVVREREGNLVAITVRVPVDLPEGASFEITPDMIVKEEPAKIEDLTDKKPFTGVEVYTPEELAKMDWQDLRSLGKQILDPAEITPAMKRDDYVSKMAGKPKK